MSTDSPQEAHQNRTRWRTISPPDGLRRVEDPKNEIVIRERSRSSPSPPPRRGRDGPRATFAPVESDSRRERDEIIIRRDPDREPLREREEIIIRRREEDPDSGPDREISGRTEEVVREVYIERSRSPPAPRYYPTETEYLSVLPEPRPVVDTSFELFNDKVNMEWELNLQSLFFKAGFSRAAYDSLIDRHKQKELEKRKLRKLGNVRTWMERSWDSSFYPEIANHMEDYYRISGHQHISPGKTPQQPQPTAETQGDKATDVIDRIGEGANALLDSDKTESQQPKPDTESKPNPDHQSRSPPPFIDSKTETEVKVVTESRDNAPAPLIATEQHSTQTKVSEIDLKEDELDAVSVWGFRPHKALSRRTGSSKNKHNHQQAKPSVMFLPDDPVTGQRTIAISLSRDTSATKIYKIRENDYRSAWKFLVLPSVSLGETKYLVVLPPLKFKEQPTVFPLEGEDPIVHILDSDTISVTSSDISNSESTKKRSKRSKNKKREKHSKRKSRRRDVSSSSLYTSSDDSESSSSSDERRYSRRKRLGKSKNSKDKKKESVRSRFRRHVTESSTSSNDSDPDEEDDSLSSSEYEYKIQKKRISKSKGDKANTKDKGKDKKKKASKTKARRRAEEFSSEDEDNDG